MEKRAYRIARGAHEQGEVLIETEKPIRYVLFPHNLISSTIRPFCVAAVSCLNNVRLLSYVTAEHHPIRPTSHTAVKRR